MQGILTLFVLANALFDIYCTASVPGREFEDSRFPLDETIVDETVFLGREGCPRVDFNGFWFGHFN